MKKIWILTILLQLPMTAYSDYRIDMPLETNKGGHLNENSIIFKKNDGTPPEIEYISTCKGVIGAGASHWRTSNLSNTGIGNMYWDGVLLASSIHHDTPYTTPEGVIYKVGNYIKEQGVYNWYELCQFIEKK